MAWSEAAENFVGFNSINALLGFKSKLYCLADSGGSLLEFDDISEWFIKSTTIGTGSKNMVVHSDNKLYALSLFGQLNVWDEISVFTQLTSNSLGPTGGLGGFLSFNGNFYTGIDILYESVGFAEFTNVAASPGIPSETFVNFIEFGGKLYGGLTNGSLYQWNDLNAWVLVADGTAIVTSFQTLKEIIIFQNKIYAVFNERTLLCEWNGMNAWIETNPASGGGGGDNLQSALVFNGFIYAANVNSELFKSTGGNYSFVHAGDSVIVNSMIGFNNQIFGAGA